MKTRSFRTDQGGVILVIALVMLLVLTLIGVAAVNLTSYESRISGNEGSITTLSMPETEALKIFEGGSPRENSFTRWRHPEVTRLPSAIV